MAKKAKTAPTEKEKKQGYWTNEWRGIQKYNCVHCSFDSFDLTVMLDHLKQHHPPPSERVPVKVPLYNRYGKLITHKEI